MRRRVDLSVGQLRSEESCGRRYAQFRGATEEIYLYWQHLSSYEVYVHSTVQVSCPQRRRSGQLSYDLGPPRKGACCEFPLRPSSRWRERIQHRKEFQEQSRDMKPNSKDVAISQPNRRTKGEPKLEVLPKHVCQE